jgi:hypothetical protein
VNRISTGIHIHHKAGTRRGNQGMDNSETLITLGTQDTGQIQHTNTTQKTKMMSILTYITGFLKNFELLLILTNYAN